MKASTYTHFLLGVLLFCACGFSNQDSGSKVPNGSLDYYADIKDDSVKKILKKAIDWAGGIEKWKKLDSIQYHKRSKLLLEKGLVENETYQLHNYSMQPSFSAEINWKKGNTAHLISHNFDKTLKYENGEIIAEGEKTKKSVLSALYVLGMPFKLLDEGVNLSHEGKTQIDGIQVDVLKATYSPAKNNNHSTEDVWWYYFQENSGKFISCMVYHSPTYAYIENLAFDEVNGLKFHKHRKSYRTDSVRNKQFLRAEFWYNDYKTSYIN